MGDMSSLQRRGTVVEHGRVPRTAQIGTGPGPEPGWLLNGEE